MIIEKENELKEYVKLVIEPIKGIITHFDKCEIDTLNNVYSYRIDIKTEYGNKAMFFKSEDIKEDLNEAIIWSCAFTFCFKDKLPSKKIKEIDSVIRGMIRKNINLIDN